MMENVDLAQARLTKAEKELAFAQLEPEYAELQAKVQAKDATDEELARYNELADQIVAARFELRQIRDALRAEEGVPEGDGVATPDTVQATVQVNNPGGS